MHVSHLRALPIPVTTHVETQVARRKHDDDPDKVPPVERRQFEEEEARRAPQRPRDEVVEEPPAEPETEESFAARGMQLMASAPPAHTEVHIAEPLDALLTGITGHPSHTEAAHDDTQPSINDLLSMMRPK
ncbi:MAG TPA: hypothetical protein VL492_10320 [Methylovirgula sp.]|jgi:hypothetical protein|nr:hypothetical protein [Methylovirgula sp.]